ncbi:hypothetical protein [Metabacillus rhizolycopersici]|uniref:Uncharacterized protein n=1 Tax=Metabacillus rhizolycopersici TaxID=2875709 RepID=A0ABS7UKZ0_9BACI|nr:hypothetical protein [Metabacillus rhizolycopersici]MBZ5748988.1 hypothetical protein [Metabacillus rhizolycopersici]
MVVYDISDRVMIFPYKAVVSVIDAGNVIDSRREGHMSPKLASSLFKSDTYVIGKTSNILDCY